MAAGIRISQLPTITAMTDDDILIVNDGDTSTRKITYANFAASIAAGAAGGVDSINGQTGIVTLTANDLSAYTKSEVDAAVAAKASNVLLGVADGDADMGTFVGSTISSNVTVKTALQELETALEGGDAGDAILGGNNVFTGTNEFQGVITASQNGNVIPFYFADQASLPNAGTYHGAIAHSHADGKMYFAHGGGWVALANGSEVFSGNYADLSGAPTLGTASAEDVSYFATAAQGTTADAALPAASVSAFGLTLVDDADAAAARSTLGLGTAAVAASADFATAAQGTTADNALPASSVSTFGGTLIDDADAAAARTTLGLGSAAVAAAADFATSTQGGKADTAVQPAAAAVTITTLPTDGTATVDQLASAINTLSTELAAILNT